MSGRKAKGVFTVDQIGIIKVNAFLYTLLKTYEV